MAEGAGDSDLLAVLTLWQCPSLAVSASCCVQVFALTKERDALKRAAAAASGGSGGGASDAAALRGQLHKKDELVSQVGLLCIHPD